MATWRSAFRAERIEQRLELLAALGASLALCRDSVLVDEDLAAFGPTHIEEIILVEADPAGRCPRAIPTNHREANSAWQMLCVLAFNLVRSFQIALGAPRRARTWKRTFGWVFQSLSTLRFELIHQPVRLVFPKGRAQLRFAVPLAAENRIEHALERIAAVA